MKNLTTFIKLSKDRYSCFFLLLFFSSLDSSIKQTHFLKQTRSLCICFSVVPPSPPSPVRVAHSIDRRNNLREFLWKYSGNALFEHLTQHTLHERTNIETTIHKKKLPLFLSLSGTYLVTMKIAECDDVKILREIEFEHLSLSISF